MSYIRILSTFLSVIFIIAKQCRKVNRILKKFLELSKHSPEIYQLPKIPFSSILNSAKQYWLTFTRPARNRSGGQVNDALEIKTHQNPPSRPQAKQRCERISGSGAYSPSGSPEGSALWCCPHRTPPRRGAGVQRAEPSGAVRRGQLVKWLVFRVK